MRGMIKEIMGLPDDIEKLTRKRLGEFRDFRDKDGREWFSELCFCILTANSKAESGIAIQEEIGPGGFCSRPAEDIRDCIRRHKHRFHNNKTSYIIQARDNIDIKDTIISISERDGEEAAREWLVKNIKGIGYKEASHFMRNVGFTGLSILDRHILRFMMEHGLIKDIPKSLPKKRYLEIEEIFNRTAEEAGITPAELDLRMWYLKTGRVLK